MPLPLLDARTFEPTGEFLPIADYFNPSKNPNFNGRYPGNHFLNGNKLNIETYIKIATAIATPDAIEDLIPFILVQYNGVNTGETYKNILRFVYKHLPAEYKWLIFTLLTSAVESLHVENGFDRYKMKLDCIFPQSIVDNEIERGIDNFEFQISKPRTTNTYTMRPSEEEDLRTKLLAFAPSVAEKWTRWENTRYIYRDDHCFGNIPKHISGYAADRALFYPTGDQSRCLVLWDWTKPSDIAAYIAEGIRVTISIRPNGNRLEFKAIPSLGDRRYLSQVLNYSSDVLEFLPYTIKGPKEVTSPTYGIELESCSDYHPRDLIAAQKDLFFIMKQDSSIRGSKPNKYEIVTVPASMKAHKRLWAELFEKIDYNMFDVTKDTGNGMHIHIGRKYFSFSHLNRFTWFITNPANFDFMFTISERPTKNDLSRWAIMPNYDHVRNKYIAAEGAYSSTAGLRGAVHFKGDKTVEVRIFKGIVSYATIIKNLEFVDSVFHFTQFTGTAQLTLVNYIAWLDKTPKNQYQTLKAFLAEVKLSDILAAAEVTDYLWHTQSELQVTELLNKAPFKVTNAHITSLNKKRRARTFVLKNGEVICLRNNGGLLAKLDKSLSKKQTRGAATFTMNEFAV